MSYKRLLLVICILLVGLSTALAQHNTLTIPDVTVAKGKTISLPIYLDNTADVVALQFTLTVPDGISVNSSSATLTERSDGHAVVLKNVGSNKYVAMVFSSKNTALKGRTGQIMSVPLTASNAVEEGMVYPLTLSDVVIAAHDGSNLATGFSAGKVSVATSPDLEVSQVKAKETVVAPQENISLNWTVANIGGQPTTAGWSEQIFLKNNQGATKLLGTLYHDEALNVEGVVSRNAEIKLPSILGMDGNCQVVVKLVPNSDAGEPSWLQNNNTAETTSTLNVQKYLLLSPEQASVEESRPQTIRFQLSRSGDVVNAENFTLACDADSRISLPQSVTIEKGNASTYFYAQVSANGVLDNDSVVHFTISGNGYPEKASVIHIEDDTYPSLSLSTNDQEVTEGGNILFKVSTQRAPHSDVEIKMTSNMASRFRIPTPIVIPAGQTSVDVTVEALEDDVPNVDEIVTFTVTAAKHNSASINTFLIDNDVPTLQLAITPKAVSEAAGPLAVTATLKRIDNIDKVVTIKLSDDSNGGIYYGHQEIKMEKGVEEVTLNLGPIDNNIVDGERVYNISAAVWIASCSCNANNGASGGVVSVPLTVYDNDGPTLTCTSSASVLKEGGEMSVTIKRNTATTHSLTVNISSDHDADLEYPRTVTISAGNAETSFVVKSKGNDITDDGFTAVLKATAEGFATGNVWFAVSDQTLPDAQIKSFAVSENEVNAKGSVVVEVTILNTGSYDLSDHTKVGIYMSNSSSAVAILYLKESLKPGENVVLTKEVTMPSSIGVFKVHAVVNDDNAIKELCTTNNCSNVVTIKTVSPFSVIVKSDKSIYRPGEKVLISGSISGADVAEKDVEVYVINDNYRHVLNVRTNNDGTFSVEYEPYTGQMGHFIIGACYPKEELRTEMAAFDFYGIKQVSKTAITCEALLGEIYTGKFSISNSGNLPLTNVTVKTISKPDNCNLTVNCPSHVDANSVFDVDFAIDATSVSEGSDWQRIELVTKSDEGVSLTTTLYYYCREKQGQLKAEILRINTTMIKGATRDYPFTITNTGKGETGKITLEIPSWMKSVTPREMSSLKYGESASVILRFAPTEEMQLNVPILGTIGLNCSNGEGLSIPFSIEPVSESTGTMIIDVCDEYTYYTAEKPHIAGASVVVTHPTTGAIIKSGTTGEDGKFIAVLPEGYYTVSVSASNHNSYKNNLLVDPGVENLKTVNLSVEAISVDWKVEETTVKDEYSVVTTVKYETSVPVPIVELSVPKNIDAKSLAEGESLIFNAILTNKGLITAEDVQLLLPTGFRTLHFEALSQNTPITLAPQQSVLIPVRVTHVSESKANAMVRVKSIDDDPCVGQIGTLYFWDCGLDRKWHRYEIAMQLGTCKSDDPSTWENSGNGTYGGDWVSGPSFGPGSIGGGYYGSSSGNSNVSTYQDKGCEPCQNGLLIAGLKCASHFVGDAVETLKSMAKLFTGSDVEDEDDPNVYQQAKGVYDLLESVASTFDACVNMQTNFDGAYKCYTSASKTIDNMFDDAVTSVFGHFVPADKLANYKSFGKKMLKWKRWIDIAADCANDFVHACDHLKDSVNNSNIPKVKAKKTTDYISSVLGELDVIHTRLNAFSNVNKIIWGNEKEWDDVSYEEMCVLTDSIDYLHSDFEQIKCFKPEALSLKQFHDFYNRRKRYLSGDIPESIADSLNENINIMQSTREHFNELGYYKPSDYTKEHVAKLWEMINEGQSSVCASITLQFSQKMVMTRQAFRGTLTVFNGNESTAMKDVKLALTVKDEKGNVATSHEFQINPESLKGFNGKLSLDEGWTLDAQQTGVATILFIPTKYAAPMVSKYYAFGGSLSYVDPFTGLSVKRDLAPVTLTVKPSPNLDLTYFMQRDIKGDNPLTEKTEPSEEAELSLLINNTGYGDATDVRMYTDQPQIIDNEKGLNIDFELMSSQLNGTEKTLALGGTVETEFGTIPAKSTAYAQWWIKSSLLGHFTKYNVEATHVTSYGNADLSLLGDVTIHELIRSLEVENGNGKCVGFMTNDMVDANDTPDMLYLSDGEVETVALAQVTNMQKVSDTDYALTVSAEKLGWNYGNVVDPTYGMATLKSVVRKRDGKLMPLRNFWQTDCTLRDGKDPLYENKIHFADNLTSSNSETYLLTFEPVPDLQLEVATIEGIPAEGTLCTEPLSKVRVMFNKCVDPSTFTTADISLAVQGVKQDVTSVAISTEDNKTFTLDFTLLNEHAENGYFVLTVNTAEVKDQEGYFGKNGKQAGWILFREGMVNLNTSTYPQSAGSIRKVQDAVEAETPQVMRVKYGTLLKLTTEANEGYAFKNWTVNGEVVSTDKILEHVALENLDIIANYSLKTYAVAVDEPNEGGVITGSASGVYSYGDVLRLTANADEDYIFEGWYVNDQKVSEDHQLTTKVNEAKHIEAKFKRVIFLQSLTLSRGWNWVSTYVNEPISVSNFMGGVTRVVSQFDETITDPAYGNVGDVETLQPGQAYKMLASYGLMKSFKGHLHSLADTPIVLRAGWNWISYPNKEEGNVNDVLPNAAEGDCLTSQLGFAAFADGYWEGTLKTLVPGQGYIYKSDTDKTLTFDFSAKGTSRAKLPKADHATNASAFTTVDVHKYPSTMNVIARIVELPLGIDNEQCRIYAFAGNECRGESRWVGNNHYLTIYGDNATNISFVVEDKSNGNTYIAQQNLTFTPEVIGSRKVPYVLTLSEATGVHGVNGDATRRMRIYNVEGILIDADATIESLKKLERGIYIIDGQKFMIK